MTEKIEKLKFINLFAGIGGFHITLEKLNMECVFASEKKEILAPKLLNFSTNKQLNIQPPLHHILHYQLPGP